jgi:hypothetical protein
VYVCDAITYPRSGIAFSATDDVKDVYHRAVLSAGGVFLGVHGTIKYKVYCGELVFSSHTARVQANKKLVIMASKAAGKELRAIGDAIVIDFEGVKHSLLKQEVLFNAYRVGGAEWQD